VKYWQSKENRKKFFDQYAQEKGFDPLLPDNWYTTTRTNISQQYKVWFTKSENPHNNLAFQGLKKQLQYGFQLAKLLC
jgi:hypothetical protein